MKKVTVQYICDECGSKAKSYDSTVLGRESQWRRIIFGGLRYSSITPDIRHACSYKCARAILADMIKNLRDNDDRAEDGSD